MRFEAECVVADFRRRVNTFIWFGYLLQRALPACPPQQDINQASHKDLYITDDVKIIAGADQAGRAHRFISCAGGIRRAAGDGAMTGNCGQVDELTEDSVQRLTVLKSTSAEHVEAFVWRTRL